MKRSLHFLAATAALTLSIHAASLDVYVGTYTDGDSKGVYHMRLDTDTGALTPPELAAESPNPSFLAVHPSGRYLFAVNEVGEFEGVPGGAITSYTIGKDGQLTKANHQSTRGGAPCHLAIDRTGRSIVVANYGGGSVASFKIGRRGFLAPASFIQHEGSSVTDRQKGPHAHAATISPDNKHVFISDLGLDKIMAYTLDARAGTLAPNEPAFTTLKPGAGPRHFEFHPSGDFAWSLNELDSTVTAFRHDADTGALESVHTVSTLPPHHEGRNSTAEIVVHPSGQFVYGSNRGHDTIAVFQADQKTGRLTLVEHESIQGKTPRSFAITPDGRHLLAAGQNSGSVVVFAVDPTSGELAPTGHSAEIPKPVCIVFNARDNGRKADR